MVEEQIIIGSGNYIVVGAGNDKYEGLQIRAAPNHGMKIDTNADDVVEGKKVVCTILFTDLKAGRLFQDQVNAACMRMNGYKIENV